MIMLTVVIPTGQNVTSNIVHQCHREGDEAWRVDWSTSKINFSYAFQTMPGLFSTFCQRQGLIRL